MNDRTGSMIGPPMVPVPTMPDRGGDLVVADRALLRVNYEEEALRSALPGYAFVLVLSPTDLWLPNAGTPAGFPESLRIPQALCLGPSIAPGTPVTELLLRTYSALTMQSVQLDPHAAEGVLNPGAARWWQDNTSRFPLCRQGLLEAV